MNRLITLLLSALHILDYPHSSLLYCQCGEYRSTHREHDDFTDPFLNGELSPFQAIFTLSCNKNIWRTVVGAVAATTALSVLLLLPRHCCRRL
jgi:hypothetical protein